MRSELVQSSLFVDKIAEASCQENSVRSETHPLRHVVSVSHPVMIVEDHYRRPGEQNSIQENFNNK